MDKEAVKGECNFVNVANLFNAYLLGIFYNTEKAGIQVFSLMHEFHSNNHFSSQDFGSNWVIMVEHASPRLVI